ncbi:ATP-binding protein [bacterium]|nr:MAG: ATP-binding protein [bacterium]
MTLHAMKPSVPPIFMEAGDGLFLQKFGNKQLIECLIELIKNCFDWRSNQVWIRITPEFVQVIDNGMGMVEANRNAFCSLAKTSGDSKVQSSKFGTGSKGMLYLCKGVTVTTKTIEGRDVIQFNIPTAEYQRQVFSHGTIQPVIITDNSWPEVLETGTILHYDFSGTPSAKQLKKTDNLAKRLAQKVPLLFMDAIQLNDQPLPPKEIKGKPFLQSPIKEKLGQVDFEIYTLKGGSTANNGVYLSSTGWEEVRMIDFVNMLPDHIRGLVPEIYLNTTELSGVITCRQFFGQFINDDRHTFSPEITNSEMVNPFVELLIQLEQEVKDRLNLEVKKESVSLKDMMSRVINLSATAYGEEFGGSEYRPVLDPDPEPEQALIIHGTQREYQSGDRVELSLDIDSSLTDAKYSDVDWLTVNSGLEKIVISKDKKTLTGIATNKTGWKTVTVRAKSHGTQTSYEIVAEKRMYLSAQRGPNVFVGQPYKLTCYNVGLAKGPLRWKIVKGEGVVEPVGSGGKQGVATAVGTSPGELYVSIEGAYEDGRPFRDACVIPIVDPETQLLNIMGYKFKVFHQLYPDKKAITMVHSLGTDSEKTVHQMFVNEKAKIWKQKDAQTSLLIPVWLIAEEFARFFYQDVEDEGKEVTTETMVKYEHLAEEVMERLNP